MKESKTSLVFAIIAMLAAFIVFMGTVNSTLPAAVKFTVAVGALVCCGMAVSRVFNLDGGYGLILLKSRKGLDFLDSVSQRWPDFWQTFAEIGLVVGYGSFAYFLIEKRKFSWKRVLTVYGTGAVLLVILNGIVAPFAMSALFSMISGGDEFAGAGSKLSASMAQIDYLKYVFLAIMAVGGIATSTMLSIAIFSATVVGSVAGVFLGNGQQLSQTTPGGTPIIPGINLDLVQGVIALAVVLIVHEGAHGIVARLYKLPLKAAGIVFFGFLPFGAFVDIDEKKLFKEKPHRQNTVFVAGTAANFATSLVFLALFLLIGYSTQGLMAKGLFVESGTLPQGAQILSINGTAIESFASANLLPNSTYSVETSKGTFERTTNAQGKIGITYSTERYPEEFGWLRWLLRLFAMIFALNYVVAAINLVAIPLFDGYYIMKNGVNNKLVETAIVYLIVFAFALNMLPWLFR